MKFNLEGKVFRSISNTENGEVDANTRFHYHQQGNVVTADYSGGSILCGHLMGIVRHNGQLDIRYHHINGKGEMMAGTCISTPQRLPDGRLRFGELWRWLSGDQSEGYSEIEEIGRCPTRQSKKGIGN